MTDIDRLGRKRLGEHMHGIDICAYCAAGDLAVKTTMPQLTRERNEARADAARSRDRIDRALA